MNHSGKVIEGLITGIGFIGGGAILNDDTRAALSAHTVVFLSVELTDAVKRVGLGAGSSARARYVRRGHVPFRSGDRTGYVHVALPGERVGHLEGERAILGGDRQQRIGVPWCQIQEPLQRLGFRLSNVLGDRPPVLPGQR